MSKKLLSVILAIVVMASLCIVNASAAANEANAKTGALHAGDKVTFTASLKYGDDTTKRLAAINATVKYDKDVLKHTAVSVDGDTYDGSFPILGNDSVTSNATVAGEILFNAANGTKGYKGFKDGGVICEFTFEVLKDAADGTTVSFSTEELFDVTLVDGKPQDGKTDITSGVTASAKVDCKHASSDTDTTTDTSSDKTSDTASDKTSDTTSENTDNKAPVTGDVATVVMMLVFAAAVVAIAAKKRA